MKPNSAVVPLALRGAVAAGVAIAMTTVLALQRPYWLIMVAVVLVNQTTGQSLRRAGQRVATTMAGFTLGWALQWMTASRHSLQIAIMLAAVFFAIFFRQSWGRGSYPWMMFFISLYVVFLFAVLGEWSPGIFVARIYDTFLGAGAALFAAYVMPAAGARARLRREAEDLWDRCRKELSRARERFCAGEFNFQQGHPELLLQLDQIRAHADETLYENFLSRAARREALERFAVAETLCYYVLGLFDAFICARNSAHRQLIDEPLTELMRPIESATFWDFEMPAGERGPSGSLPIRPEACRLAVELCRARRVPQTDSVWALPALYYAAAMLECRR